MNDDAKVWGDEKAKETVFTEKAGDVFVFS